MASASSSPTQTDSTAAEQRSISELLQQLTEQTTRLAQREIELAQENQVPLAIAGAFVTGVLLGRLLSR